MAHPTIEQKDVLVQLGTEYGEPDFTMIEHTKNAYGIVWCQWTDVPGLYAEEGSSNRNRLIRPDGTIVSWDQLR